MWWNKREEDSPDGRGAPNLPGTDGDGAQLQHRTSSVPSKKSRVGGTNRQSFLGSKSLTARRNRKKQQNLGINPQGDDSESGKESDAARAQRNGSDSNTGDFAETHMGFEVSLAELLVGGDSSAMKSPMAAASAAGKTLNQHVPLSTSPRRQLRPVISFQKEILKRQKVTRSQYNVSQWPALGIRLNSSNGDEVNDQKQLSGLPNNKNHRVVLQPEETKKNYNYHQSSSSELSAFEDALFLLRSHEVVDEITSIKEEIGYLNAELDALALDKNKLQDMTASLESFTISQRQEAAASASSIDANALPTTWDANELLVSKRATIDADPATTATSTSDERESDTISVEQRSFLQHVRGTMLTVFLHDRAATEALAMKCGVKPHVLARFRENPQTSALELSLDTCREGGAAMHIAQVSLLCKGGGRACELGFFIGRDQGKSISWGHLPDRLYRRMQDSGMNAKQSAAELVYLSVGPMDYYYAEFRSGEVWWGSASEDQAFQTICKEWDVYRVVFGPAMTMDDYDSELHSRTMSWIIVSRDGRAAWKNLPSRLHGLLSRRMTNEAGIAEVSLGSCGSYFCRFLDGTMDYCLPAQHAHVVQELESRGLKITNIALHPELSQDFVIRSTYR